MESCGVNVVVLVVVILGGGGRGGKEGEGVGGEGGGDVVLSDFGCCWVCLFVIWLLVGGVDFFL